MADRRERSAGFDPKVAHIARIQNYWRGGKDNFAVDRAAGQEALRAYPDLARSVRANRAFLARAVRYLAGEAGVRQFLDIGPGIPAAGSTHEVAAEVSPGCRVVYVDSDPVVLSHARALLRGGRPGVTECLDADLRDTAVVLAGAAGLLDLGQPVALMLVSVLHLVPDDDGPHAVVAALLEALAPGSYLALTHVGSDLEAAATARMASRLNRMMSGRATPRSRAEVARFFDGLELVPPGLARVPLWRPESQAAAASPSTQWCGVARKPAA